MKLVIIASRHLVEQMRETIARGVATAAGLDRNTAVQIGVELALQRPTVGRMNLKQIEGDPDFRTRWLCPT